MFIWLGIIKIVSKIKQKIRNEEHEKLKEELKEEYKRLEEEYSNECQQKKIEYEIQKEKYENGYQSIKTYYEKLTDKHKSLQAEYRLKYQDVIDNFNYYKKECQSEIKKLFEDPLNKFPYFATLFSDYIYTIDLDLANKLEKKKHPAQLASDDVKNIAHEKKEWTRRAKEAEYKLAYYEAMVPILEELDDGSLDPEPIRTLSDSSDDSDATTNWISRDEYFQLSPTDRNCLALERYKKHKKSKREIGKEYERYIGYRYELKGYKVEYKGILSGLEDLGRDLICTKDDEAIIIQCKCWSKNKVIHEKHINQLFGTFAKYQIEQQVKENPNAKPYVVTNNTGENPKYRAVFVTSTKLSPTAQSFADALGIERREEFPLEDFPMIKCNVSRKSGEKIYHLPFDNSYDSVYIEKERGELYASTVAEAEEKGFRRAFKWIATETQ